MGSPVASRSSGRRALLAFATISQIGTSYTQQGVVIIGIFFLITYHLSLAQMGLMTSCISLGWMASSIFTGALMDRIGPRHIFLVGIVLMTGGALLVSLVHQILLTALALVVIGIGLSTVPLAGTKTVMVAWPRTERGMPMGIRQTGVPVGSMIAALTLPILAEALGLHTIFLILAVVLLVCNLIFWFHLPTFAAPPTRSAPVTIPLGRDLRRIALPGACGFLMAWGQYVLLTYTVPQLHTTAAMPVAAAGVLIALAQVGASITRIIVGALSDRRDGRRDDILGFMAFVGTALAVVVAALPAHVPYLVLMVLWFALGSMLVGWNALLMTWAGERVAPTHAGMAMGLSTACVLFGAVICPPIFGLIVQGSGGYRIAWLVLAAILGLAGTLIWLARSQPGQASDTRKSANESVASPA